MKTVQNPARIHTLNRAVTAPQRTPSIHLLQRTIGNRAVGQLLRNGDPVALARARHGRISVRQTSAPSVQRGEEWDQVKGVGPLDAWSAKKDADTALAAAKSSGLPGLWNGPGDAFRHALWNCLMTRSIGADQAKTVADTHEVHGKNHANEQLMDDHNNAIGRLLAINNKKKDCVELVVGALKRGNLLIIPNYKAVAGSKGKVAPDPPVRSNTVKLPKSKVKDAEPYG